MPEELDLSATQLYVLERIIYPQIRASFKAFINSEDTDFSVIQGMYEQLKLAWAKTKSPRPPASKFDEYTSQMAAIQMNAELMWRQFNLEPNQKILYEIWENMINGTLIFKE